eukprot:11766854-Alexandrium_andersonii.AAC.1
MRGASPQGVAGRSSLPCSRSALRQRRPVAGRLDAPARCVCLAPLAEHHQLQLGNRSAPSLIHP